MVSSINSSAYKRAGKPIPAHNPVIEGHFPVFEDFKELAIFKLNRFLSLMLIMAVVLSMISYSIVVAKENVIINVHNKTNDINFENIELQNKVDYVRSFYNVNDKISKINFLKKPDKVLEVNAIASVPAAQNKESQHIQPVLGY